MARLQSLPDLEVASIFFGLFLGLSVFTLMKVTRQSWTIWKRTHSIWNFYLLVIWVEAVVNVVFALTTYLYLRGDIRPSLGYFFIACTLWTIQTQLLLQIIANRIGLIMVDQRKAHLIKYALFIVVGLINISVFCVWIPALLDVNPTFVVVNKIWERVEKSLFLLIDAGLNIYFLYLVRSNLISKGLTKYWALFNFNAAIVVVSVALDILLLGMLSLPNTYDYVQFSPVVYIAKLNIELTMAELISKVVRSAQRVDGGNSDPNNGSNSTRRHTAKPMPQPNAYFPGTVEGDKEVRFDTAESLVPMSGNENYLGDGIMKTVTTLIGTESGDDSDDCFSQHTIGQKSIVQ